MTQSKLASFYEAVFSTAIGFGLSFVLGQIVFPLYGFAMSIATNFQITLIFTVLSIARGYVIRRWFNGKLAKAAQKLAGATQ